ncbi:hypothetical protein ACLUS2_005925 [Curtobacterium flaccumfaciens pv. flaccumfaciens]|uniref:hypothetical protein n=1 Tax=Curtobacterium flaccumfaciens TaxID=2035 RepID=UPI0039933A1A
MYLFLVDETNKNPVHGNFFILGGLVFTPEQVAAVHQAVQRIRAEHGYQDGDSFKFQTAARPPHVTVEQSRQAKEQVIAALGEAGVRLLTYVVLHDIAMNQDEQKVMEMGLNTITWAYYRLLRADSAEGSMLIDRDDKQHNYLAHLFQHGVQPGSHPLSMQDRILLYGQTSNNASHLSSAVDIALGGFRYCVNAASRETEKESEQVVAANIFAPLSKLLWGVQRPDVRQVGGYGFHTRPSDVRKPAFAAKYDELRAKLASYSNSSTTGDTASPS